MPRKRAAYGSFTNGERMWETYLKVTGWKSEYKSVQRLLNHLARRIKSEGSRECYLSWLYRYCRKVGKDPEEVVASEPLWIRESMQDFVELKEKPATFILRKGFNASRGGISV
ncbi:MAG: hypothetical protein JRN51_06375, partial [Nitrososphaerota archaeon]|nr:hypothetical protein [Nitrososphaerota archaeon]